jgi:hypothetical protein
MAVVYAQDTPRLTRHTRLPWIQEPHTSQQTHGIYIFGGLDGLTGEPQNDLYKIRPDYRHNKRVVAQDGEYKKLAKPSFVMFATKIKAEGKGPCPRQQHGMCYF